MAGETKHPTPKSSLLRHLLGSLEPGRRYLVSVSGGVDSMALLDGMIRCQQSLRIHLRVFTAHHQTGVFADLSLSLVQRFCREHQIECVVRTFPGSSSDENFEFSARQWRHQTLQSCLQGEEFAVMAHHREDFWETILLSFGRFGNGVTSVSLESKRLLRPLVNLPKEWILAHTRLFGVPHLVDPTNLQEIGFRSQMRRQTLVQNNTIRAIPQGFLSFWASFQEQQRLLREDAQRVKTQHRFLMGSLRSEAFSPQQPYLWPFLLDGFVREHFGKPLSRRRQQQVLSRLASRRPFFVNDPPVSFWWDLDGLVLALPKAPEGLTNLENPMFWSGLWIRQEPCVSRRFPLQLLPGAATPKGVREVFRKERLPFRYRSSFPCLILEDGQVIHLLQDVDLLRNDYGVGVKSDVRWWEPALWQRLRRHFPILE
jgi:tRNA(Ile)-lysidine synthetase-like protein